MACIFHATCVLHSMGWCPWQVVMRPAMHQVEAVTGRRGAGGEAAGVVGAPEEEGVREAEELLQKAKVGCHSQCPFKPIYTFSWGNVHPVAQRCSSCSSPDCLLPPNFQQLPQHNEGVRACFKVHEMPNGHKRCPAGQQCQTLLHHDAQ